MRTGFPLLPQVLLQVLFAHAAQRLTEVENNLKTLLLPDRQSELRGDQIIAVELALPNRSTPKVRNALQAIQTAASASRRPRPASAPLK